MSRYFHAGEPDFFAMRVTKQHPKNPNGIDFLSKHGIYALMMSDESMDLANFESVHRN